MKKIYFVKCFLLLFILGLSVSSKAQVTYNFSTPATISRPSNLPWDTQANITIGGVGYKLSSGGNGSFTNSTDNGNGNSASLMKTGSGGDSFVLERVDGQPFQFYSLFVRMESISSYTNIQGFTIPPWYTISYTKTAGAPESETDMTAVSGGTYTTSAKTYSKNLTVTRVDINFQANSRYWIDDIIVGTPAGTEVAPTVTSAAASAITSNSATIGGNVTADGGATVTEKGIVWSTGGTPTTSNNKINMGNNIGAFSGTVGSLPFNTTIHHRAYAINSKGTSYGSELTFITLGPTIVVNPTTIPDATVGVTYNQTITGSGGASPYTFIVSAGALPLGLSLNTTTGALTGTPISAGAFNFSIRATDNSGSGGYAGSRSYSLIIAPPTILIAPTTVSGATVGVAYNQSITASGGIAPYSYAITAGVLPSGITLSSGGVLSGTASSGGTFNFTVTATGSSTGTGSPHVGARAYTLSVAAPTVVVSPTTLPNAGIGSAYSQNITATGGTGPRSFTITAGALPVGLGLSSTGILSGTPTSGGTYNFTVRATDASGGTGPYSGSRAYVLTVSTPTIVVNPTTLPGALVATAYSQVITVTGGIAPHSFDITAGALPSGLSLSSAGILSGMPTGGGIYNFTISATDASTGTGPYAGSRAYSLVVASPTIAVSPVSLPNGTAATAYSQAITASGGTFPYTYARTAGSLPTGMILSPLGVLSGTPTSEGTYNFTVTATDASGGNGPYTGSRAYSITIATPTIAINPATLPNPVLGVAYSQNIAASGGTSPYSFLITAGGLPVGMSLNSSGVLSGTPAGGGTYNFTISATDTSPGTGPYIGSRAYSITIATPTIAINPATLPNPVLGVAYSQNIAASGGTSPYSFLITAGALPLGMSLNSSGVLSGTPAGGGIYNFTISATDASTGTGPYTGSRAYTITIAAPTIAINPATIPNPVLGVAYSQNIAASGGTAPYSFLLTAGALPIGMSFNSAGLLSGTPTSGGIYNFTISATDASTGTGPYTGSRAYSITIAAPTIVVNPTTLSNPVLGVAYSQNITAGGGIAPYSFSLTAGALPVGMSLNSAGVLSGTPTGGGSYNFTISATDASTGTGPYTGSRAYSLAIAAPTIVINPTLLPNGTVGTVYNQTLTSSGGIAPRSFALVAGALPVGLSFTSAGVLSGTPAAGGNYSFSIRTTDSSVGGGPYSTTNAYNLNIDFIPQTITMGATATTNYGDADINPAASSSSGLTVSYSTSDPTVATIVAGKVHIVGAGIVSIYADQPGDATYSAAAQKTQILTINKASLTYTANSAIKVYGASNPIFSGTVTGFKYTDNLASATTGTATFTSTATNLSAVGSYQINGAGLSAANYTFTQAGSNATSLNITPKPITVTADAGQSKVYGSAEPTLAYSITTNGPLVGTDAFTGALSRIVGENVGSYSINQGNLALNSNYSLTFVGANFAVTPKAITVAANAGQSKVYGAANPTFTYSITAGGPLIGTDSFTGALTRTVGENIGVYVINQGTLALNANYSLSFTSANFIITPKAIIVTANTGQRKTYGQSNPVLTYAITTGGPLVTGDAFTGALARSSGENVGSYAINQGNLALNPNYAITYIGGNFAINPASLTITADNKDRFFGGANPTLTASYDGFVNGETNTVLTTQPVLATVANTTSPIGDYPITVTGAAAQNYAISYVNGILKVKAGAPTNISLASATLYENRPAATNAGILSSSSDDPSATFTYTLVTGTGDTDNALFAINGTNVNTTVSLDFETKTSYSIRVKSTTQFGLSLEKVLTIALSDVNEIPTLAAINNVTRCFTSSVQTVALSGISAGPEAAQTTTITVSSNNAALFESLAATKTGTTGSVNYVVKNGASGVATVTITIKDNGGTANGGVDNYTRTFTVTINPLPIVVITSDKGNSISKGDIARLTATGGSSYVWTANNSIIGGQNTAVLTVRPQVNTIYTVTATNATSCSQSQSFALDVIEDYIKINANNILTPNNDGYNDKWVVDNIDFYPNNEVKVFDRAGRIIYSKKGYDNSWDGTVNGNPLVEGTYYYIIDFGTDRLKFRGYITLIRAK